MCVKIIQNCLYSHGLIMPFYAVAVGRNAGIYSTYDECKQQVQGFPNAKFKKFETKHDAEEFINNFSSKPSCSSGLIFNVENINKPKLFPLKRRNDSLVDTSEICEKLRCLEEKIDRFISSTTSSLDDLKGRLTVVENLCVAHSSENDQPKKKVKVEEDELLQNIDDSSFIRNHENVVNVFTDGACSNNGKTGAMAGIGVWFNHNHPLNVSLPLKGPATNNNAEIQAARVAVHQAVKAGLDKLCIHTDSQFLINCITEWIHKWKKNNWKSVTGENVKNKVELVKLDNALQMMKRVEWIYVKGHKGIEGNEMADKLARNGAANYKKNVTYSDHYDS